MCFEAGVTAVCYCEARDVILFTQQALSSLGMAFGWFGAMQQALWLQLVSAFFLAMLAPRVEDWLLVGKFLVSGPRGNQERNSLNWDVESAVSLEEWTLDTGMVQSLEVEGWGLRESNTVRILEKGQTCREA